MTLDNPMRSWPYKLRILSPFVLYFLSLLAASWLFLTALGSTFGWEFRPVPPGVDSVALTQAIFATFDDRLWYLCLLFLVFIALWLAFGVMFWGAVDSSWRQWTTTITGLLMVVYSFVVPWLVLNSITEVEWVTAVYFPLVWALAVAGAVIYRIVAGTLKNGFVDHQIEFNQLEQSLETMANQVSDFESALLRGFRDNAYGKLSIQRDRFSGTIFSLSTYPDLVAEAQDAVQEFSRALRSSVTEEIDKSLGVLDQFGQEAKESIIDWVFSQSPEQRDLIKRFEQQRRAS